MLLFLEPLFKFILGSKVAICGLLLVALMAGAVFKTRHYYVAKIDALKVTQTAEINAIHAAQKKVIDDAAVVAKVVTAKEVIRYVNKVVTIKQKAQEIIARTDKELQNESHNCTIGPMFIRLHNDAASTLSGTSERVDGSSASDVNPVSARSKP